jgi:hypothetical protein
MKKALPALDKSACSDLSAGSELSFAGGARNGEAAPVTITCDAYHRSV